MKVALALLEMLAIGLAWYVMRRMLGELGGWLTIGAVFVWWRVSIR